MHPEFGILQDIIVILAAVVIIIPLFGYLRIPALVGFLVTGILIGPHGFQFVQEDENVSRLAEIGVALLLFTIGLEFPLRRLAHLRRLLLVGGGLQVLATVGLVILILVVLGVVPQEAIMFGFLVSLSSTAIVMKVLSDQRATNSPHGRIALGILIFQDLCFVPMALLIPMLGATGEQSMWIIVVRLGIALSAVAAIIVGGRYIMPFLLNQVVRVRSRELFVLAVVLVSLGTAWVTSLVGLSLALGAFVAGLVLSESDYSHQIFAEVLPLRDALGSLFFVSVGMLLDVRHAVAVPGLLLSSTAVLMTIKILVVLGVVTLVLKYPVRIGLVAALGLSQVGEFSFILAGEGVAQELITADVYQSFLAATVLTMLATPFLIGFSPGIVDVLVRRFPRLAQQEVEDEERALTISRQEGHVIIVGYGVNGKNVATVLRETGIPYVILDLDQHRVAHARANGEPIVFGDGARSAILSLVHVEKARVLVVAFSDPDATQKLVRVARGLNPDIHIIVRTHYLEEMEDLYSLGADQVIPEEFETSIEIFTRVLREYHVPRNVIAAQVDLLRRSHYGMMRGLRLPDATMSQLSEILAGGTTDTFLVLNESPASGRTLEELNLRSNSGATVIAVVRKEKPITNPPPDLRLEAGDILVLIGTHAQIDTAFDYLSPERRDEE